MRMKDVFKDKTTAESENAVKEPTFEEMEAKMGGTENAKRIMNVLVALEAAGCFDNITFDDIVKGGN